MPEKLLVCIGGAFFPSYTCAQVENPTCDYTPPQFITLLFTDLGILTPSAVSDELIKVSCELPARADFLLGV